MPPQKILKFRCLEMLFSTFSRQYLGLLAHAKAWDLVLWKCPRRSTTLWSRWSASSFYPSTERSTRLKLLKCAFTYIVDSDFWAGWFTIIFAGSFHDIKPVSCWILFCENVAGVPRPFEQFPSRVAKVNMIKTPEIPLLFQLRRLRRMSRNSFCWMFFMFQVSYQN